MAVGMKFEIGSTSSPKTVADIHAWNYDNFYGNFDSGLIWQPKGIVVYVNVEDRGQLVRRNGEFQVTTLCGIPLNDRISKFGQRGRIAKCLLVSQGFCYFFSNGCAKFSNRTSRLDYCDVDVKFSNCTDK